MPTCKLFRDAAYGGEFVTASFWFSHNAITDESQIVKTFHTEFESRRSFHQQRLAKNTGGNHQTMILFGADVSTSFVVDIPKTTAKVTVDRDMVDLIKYS